MSANSRASSDPVDLEKRAAGMKTAAGEEEELAVVDPRKADLIRRSLDIFFVVYLLFHVGVLAVMVMVSNNWWDPWPGVLILSPIFVGTLWLTPKMKGVYIQLYATKWPPGSDSDLSTKLLAAEK
ncbi:uncharacterized protein LOC133900975 [Phragmites australis]|uniref:uncharacterized protein LOC133900975 n=1 Tax=Phragmites australis TaxID=29695 RepID=UPI002D777E66|nr:uncharacterized protein LOC133900975 [Phragmites australis]